MPRGFEHSDEIKVQVFVLVRTFEIKWYCRTKVSSSFIHLVFFLFCMLNKVFQLKKKNLLY